MQIEVKYTPKHLDPNLLPQQQTTRSAGFDLRADIVHDMIIWPGEVKLINTGLYVNMDTLDDNICAFALPRSSFGKLNVTLANSVGLIDQDYQGEVMLTLANHHSEKLLTIKNGDRIGQLVFVPWVNVVMKPVEEFSTTTERGTGGHGSTGK